MPVNLKQNSCTVMLFFKLPTQVSGIVEALFVGLIILCTYADYYMWLAVQSNNNSQWTQSNV